MSVLGIYNINNFVLKLRHIRSSCWHLFLQKLPIRMVHHYSFRWIWCIEGRSHYFVGSWNDHRVPHQNVRLLTIGPRHTLQYPNEWWRSTDVIHTILQRRNFPIYWKWIYNLNKNDLAISLFRKNSRKTRIQEGYAMFSELEDLMKAGGSKRMKLWIVLHYILIYKTSLICS